MTRADGTDQDNPYVSHDPRPRLPQLRRHPVMSHRSGDPAVNATGTPGAADPGRTVVRPAAPRRERRIPTVEPAPMPSRPRAVRPSLPRLNLRARAPRPARHGCLATFLWLATLIIVPLMLLRYAPSSFSNGRLIPELASFCPWLAIPSAIVAALAILWRRRLLALVSVACLAAQVVWHLGYFVPSPSIATAARQPVPAASTSDSVARVMTLNCAYGGADASEIVRIVREQRVEVLALQEVTSSFLANLRASGLYDQLPYRVIGEAGSNDNGGRNALFSLAPVSAAKSSLLPVTSSAAPAATVQIGGRPVRLVSVHIASPRTGVRGTWNEGLSDLGLLSQYAHDYVIMGDFNSTWDHSRFRKLLGDELVDASQQAGEGLHMTWPSDPSYAPGPMPPVIEIDHILHARDSGISVAGITTEKVAGTDHLALLGTLAVSAS